MLDRIFHFLFNKFSYTAHWTTCNFEINLSAYEMVQQNDKHDKIYGKTAIAER